MNIRLTNLGVDGIQLSDISLLIYTLLDFEHHPWRRHVEIITDYMPPHPLPSTVPRCVVRYTGSMSSDEEEGFLRYSKGPRQGHFWDMYGDDYTNLALALVAVLHAPPPPKRYSQVFNVPLDPVQATRDES